MTANELRAWRLARGWTQREAAEATGYTEGSWREIEAGRREVSRRLALLIAQMPGR